MKHKKEQSQKLKLLKMTTKIRILIVDDHQLILKGIICSLKEVGDFDIVTANTCDDALNILKIHQVKNPFQILFTDLSFSNNTSVTVLENGEALIKEIRNSNIMVKIAVITGHSETNKVFNVIRNLNPDAYLLKSKSDAKELLFAIEKIQENDYYYTHEIHQKIMKRTIIEVKMDDIAIQILKELPKHPKISNLEDVIIKPDGSTIKLRSIESRLAKLRADLDANNNSDLLLKAKELGIID